MPEIPFLCADQIENNLYIFNFVISIISFCDITFTLKNRRGYIMNKSTYNCMSSKS